MNRNVEYLMARIDEYSNAIETELPDVLLEELKANYKPEQLIPGVATTQREFKYICFKAAERVSIFELGYDLYGRMVERTESVSAVDSCLSEVHHYWFGRWLKENDPSASTT